MATAELNSSIIPFSYSFPSSLTKIDQWLAYSVNATSTGLDKLPIGSDGSRDAWSENLASYEAAKRLAVQRKIGLGFCFQPGDGFVGIDLDSCRDPATGTIEVWAETIIEMFDTFTEISVSGTGVKLILQAELAQGRTPRARKFEPTNAPQYGKHSPHASIKHGTNGFFALTGRHYRDEPKQVNNCQEAFDRFVDEFLAGWVSTEQESYQVDRGKLSGDLLSRMLNSLDPTEYRDHDRWFSLLAASHQATAGSPEGCQVFVDWSTSDPEFADHGDGITRRWSSFDATKVNGITLATLVHEVQEQNTNEAFDSLEALRNFEATNDFLSTNRPSNTPRKDRMSYAGMDVSELEGWADQPVDWLVTDVFGADQPTVFGARSKAGKTTQLSDLAVALSSGTPWLSFFNVPKKRKVLFITGESNYRATAKRLQRACNARGMELADLAGKLRVEAIDFPKLPRDFDRAAIQQDIAEFSFDVVIIDPLYRGIPADMDTNRMAGMGDAIVGFAKACQPASLIISHHTTKSGGREYGKPPELEDMTGAGIAESCGNWWLLGRTEPYQWDYRHDLCVQYGGRDEQAGAKRIVFDEFTWEWKVESLLGYRQTKAQEAEERKISEKEAQRQLDMRCVVVAMEDKPPNSRRHFQSLCGTISRDRFYAAFDLMVENGEIIKVDYVDVRNRNQRGFQLKTEL